MQDFISYSLRVLCLFVLALNLMALNSLAQERDIPTVDWTSGSEFYRPPGKFAEQYGSYRDVLRFDGGQQVKSQDDWSKRRVEIKDYWHSVLGPWPELLERPQLKYLESTKLPDYVQHRVAIEIAAGVFSEPHYLLMPHGRGPFPAVVVTWYNAEDSAGLTPSAVGRFDFGVPLVERGFVVLCFGGTLNIKDVRDPQLFAQVQPLSLLAYTAANACNLLANLPEVDRHRIGIMGHSFGGKWAMFASCLHDGFACAVWGDPAIVWKESDPNGNYWEKWYLGYEFEKSPAEQRRPGLISNENLRTGAYRRLVEEGRNIHELHALMAPRPFLVSGGGVEGQDGPEHWIALNHTIRINRLLGFENRVAMTIRNGHAPTKEANEQAFQFLQFHLQAIKP
ncbi:MAG: prolyl oligopeptidase family serine peptidase [Planctomycetaceae bacterium]|nr:prolyl oligopeptidase family serine peptidase [Planctomycetaceae bacterium]